jgi:hypothetical protein
MKRIVCVLFNHKYVDARLSYYQFTEKQGWSWKEEPAKYCKRCGILAASKSKLLKRYINDDVWVSLLGR